MHPHTNAADNRTKIALVLLRVFAFTCGFVAVNAFGTEFTVAAAETKLHSKFHSFDEGTRKGRFISQTKLRRSRRIRFR